MRYSLALVFAILSAYVSAHGLITEIQGANGVNMPGLSGTVDFLSSETSAVRNFTKLANIYCRF